MKQDFNIEGSVALKRAFVEECGLPLFPGHSIFDEGSYITSWPDGGGLQGCIQKRRSSLHLILPQDWNEALEYVKSYYKPVIPDLPVIHGYVGKIEDGFIIYGCAKLPIEWFTDYTGANRTISSVVLSSGVALSDNDVKMIRDVVNHSLS